MHPGSRSENPSREGHHPTNAGRSRRRQTSAAGRVAGALRTFPAEMQEVQTRTRCRTPSSPRIRTLWRLGSHLRFVLLLA